MKSAFIQQKKLLLLMLLACLLGALHACKTHKTVGGGCDCPGFGTGHIKKRHL